MFNASQFPDSFEGLTMQTPIKRGTRIEYSYGMGGKVVSGKIVRTYSAKEIEQHRRSHGESAATDLPNWVVCELSDDAGSYRGACHVSQIRVTDNRASVAA